MLTLRSGFAVLAVGAAIIIAAFASCLSLLVFTDEYPQFFLDEAREMSATPRKARTHLANISHWALWRTKLRSEPPIEYEFHRLIDMIRDTVEPETYTGTANSMSISLVEGPSDVAELTSQPNP